MNGALNLEGRHTTREEVFPIVQPVFIAGALRSGTTLLHLMLDHLPGTMNPGEWDFLFDYFSEDFGEPEKKQFYASLKADRIFQSNKLCIDESLELKSLLHDFVQQKSKPECVTTINVHRNFHRIPVLFPNAKIIHMVRDPRDVARSSIGMGWAGHAYFGVDHWIDSEKSWVKCKPLLGDDQYIEISYEDLITDTEATIALLSEFMGVPYDPKFMSYAEHSTYGRPDVSLIEQWKRKAPEREVQLIECKLGEMLTESGYEASQFEAIQHIPAMASVTLQLGNWWFKQRFSVKRYGLYLHLAEKISRKLSIHAIHRYYRFKIDVITQKGLK